jgi:hypothetical protein
MVSHKRKAKRADGGDSGRLHQLLILYRKFTKFRICAELSEPYLTRDSQHTHLECCDTERIQEQTNKTKRYREQQVRFFAPWMRMCDSLTSGNPDALTGLHPQDCSSTEKD